MKKAFVSLLLLAGLALVGCNSDQETTSSSSEAESVTTSSETDSQSSPSTSSQSFSIVGEDNGVSLAETSYTFAKLKEGDSADWNKASISLTCDNSWNLVSSLDEDDTKFIIEDSSIIQASALKLDPVLDSEIHGSSGSNEIVGFNILIDRSKIEVGETYLTVQFRPNNGPSSTNVLTSLTMLIEVVEYGEVEVDYITADISVDVNGIEDKLVTENPTYISLHINQDNPIYGSVVANYTVSQDIDLTSETTTFTFNDYKMAKDEAYSAWIFVEYPKASDRLWIPLNDDGSEGVDVTPGNNETAIVFESDNASLKLKL